MKRIAIGVVTGAILPAGIFFSSLFFTGRAHAAEPVVVVQTPDHAERRYSDPPVYARPAPVAVDPEEGSRPAYGDQELYRSPMRLHLGPVAATTGRSLGLGLGVAADFGRGSVGFRLAAAWARGEESPLGSTPSPIGDGLAQYTGELVLDLHKRGPVHPLFGLGFGLAHLSRGDLPGGNLGIGTARLGLEYALALDDADVRLGAGIMGVLPGPAEREVQDARGWALIGASLGIGF